MDCEIVFAPGKIRSPVEVVIELHWNLVCEGELDVVVEEEVVAAVVEGAHSAVGDVVLELPDFYSHLRRLEFLGRK